MDMSTLLLLKDARLENVTYSVIGPRITRGEKQTITALLP